MGAEISSLFGTFNSIVSTLKVTVIRSPENPKRVLIKRILAIEGDTVKTLPPYAQQEVVIPEGHIWIEGASFTRYQSPPTIHQIHKGTSPSSATTATDSGLFVASLISQIPILTIPPQVSASLVESKLVILLWPPDRFGRLNDVRRDAKSARVVSSFAKSVDELQATRSPDAH